MSVNYLSTYDFKPQKTFWSNTSQINYHMDLFRKANEAALDRNTEAIQEQTQQQADDALAFRTLYTEQQTSNRTLYTTQQEQNRSTFGRFIDAVVGLFSNDRNKNQELDNGAQTYYELAIIENQNLRNQLSANTNAMVSILSDIKTEINDVETAIKANTTGDASNTASIVNKLEAIRNKIPNSYVGL